MLRVVLLFLSLTTLTETMAKDGSYPLSPSSRIVQGRQVCFVKNVGQWDRHILYKVDGSTASLWITDREIYYQFTRGTRQSDRRLPITDSQFVAQSIEQRYVKVSFAGKSSISRVLELNSLEHKHNYFLGNDPSRWRTNVPTYQSVVLKDIFPGVDLHFSSDERQALSCEFTAVRAEDLRQVRIEYETSEGVSLDTASVLSANVPWGQFSGILKVPESNNLPVSLAFTSNSEVVQNDDSLLDRPASSGALEIVYSTLIGGEFQDDFSDFVLDDSGYVYLLGSSNSQDFPLENPLQTLSGHLDIIVCKIPPSGYGFVSSTFIGGNDFDYGHSIAIDTENGIYVTGYTHSPDFPTRNAFQADQNYTDAFVTKLSNTGDSLIYSTYLGGNDWDNANSIAVDHFGQAYVTGMTDSPDFPTVNPIQNEMRDNDVFVTKLGADGGSLVYSTYLGGSDWELAYDIVLDDGNLAYITGYTKSTDFPTKSAYQLDRPGIDAFVTKLGGAGDSIVFSTYLGGAQNDHARSISVDNDGAVYVAGYTMSPDFPTVNSLQAHHGNHDGFVTKLEASGGSLKFSTFLGGAGGDTLVSMVVDDLGFATVVGYTTSTDYPVLNHCQVNQAGTDCFVARLGTVSPELIYSTYLGGNRAEMANAVAIDSARNIYVAGRTGSSDFPMLNSYQGDQGFDECFLTKLRFTTSFTCGDIDGNSEVGISDVVYVISFIFAGGLAPNPYLSADVDCNGLITISDAVYLIKYTFLGGSEPCSLCR